MFPTVVPLQGKIDLHERTPLGPLGFTNEPHASFLWRAVGLERVAFDAGADNIFPNRRAAPVTRSDMIQVQIFTVKNFAAVLADIFVAFKNVVACELDLFFWQPIIDEQQDDAWDADTEGNGVNGFLVRRVFGEVAPFVKVESAERAVFSVHNDHNRFNTRTCWCSAVFMA